MIETFCSFIHNEKNSLHEVADISWRSPLVGQLLRETPIRAELDIVIISIRRSDGEIVFNPAAQTVIAAGDILIAIGQIEALSRLNELARTNN